MLFDLSTAGYDLACSDWILTLWTPGNDINRKNFLLKLKQKNVSMSTVHIYLRFLNKSDSDLRLRLVEKLEEKGLNLKNPKLIEILFDFIDKGDENVQYDVIVELIQMGFSWDFLALNPCL